MDFYVPGLFTTQAGANVGGVSGSALGSLIGVGLQMTLSSGATYYATAVGFEADIGVQSGASANEKVGFKVVAFSSDAVHGMDNDAGVMITASGIASGGGFNHESVSAKPEILGDGRSQAAA